MDRLLLHFYQAGTHKMQLYCPFCFSPLSLSNKGVMQCKGYYMGDFCDYDTRHGDAPLNQNALDDITAGVLAERALRSFEAAKTPKAKKSVKQAIKKWLAENP